MLSVVYPFFQNNSSYNLEFMTANLRNQTHRRMTSKVEESTKSYLNLLRSEGDHCDKEMEHLSDQMSDSHLDNASTLSTQTHQNLDKEIKAVIDVEEYVLIYYFFKHIYMFFFT